jgi:hypothetical protein
MDIQRVHVINVGPVNGGGRVDSLSVKVDVDLLVRGDAAFLSERVDE